MKKVFLSIECGLKFRFNYCGKVWESIVGVNPEPSEAQGEDNMITYGFNCFSKGSDALPIEFRLTKSTRNYCVIESNELGFLIERRVQFDQMVEVQML